MKTLLLFGLGCTRYQEYMTDFSYKKIIIASNPYCIRGLSGDISIVFTQGWWAMSHCSEILDVLHVYIHANNAKVLGYKEFIPPFLLDIYEDRTEEGMEQKTKKRWEILDLRL